jgi:hypothetical protein
MPASIHVSHVGERQSIRQRGEYGACSNICTSRWHWRLPASELRFIEIAYAPAEIEWFGIRLHWVIWFVLLWGFSFFAAGRLLRAASELM